MADQKTTPAVGSSELVRLIRANPHCRVTVRTSKPRKPNREGDVVWKRGIRYVRHQMMMGGAYVVSRGRPVWELVREDEPNDPN